MFYSIKNLTAGEAVALEKPWDWQPAVPLPDFKGDKSEFQRWCYNAKTEHAFISGFEGMSPAVRISTNDAVGNHAVSLHGLVIDFDAAQNVAERVQLAITQPPNEYLPTHFYESFRFMRGIWQFEKPISLPPNPRAIRKFLSLVAKKVAFKKWGSGWEEESYYQLSKYYSLYGNWQPVAPDYRISSNMLYFWLFEACKSYRLSDQQYRIPLEIVAREVEKRWPNRWSGAFDEGARGLRFWDDSSSDETVCQVHLDGMIVYNGDPKPFMTWKDIFGNSFVEKFEADRVAPIKEKTVYDSKAETFYSRQEDDTWLADGKGDFSQRLRTLGFSNRIAKGETASEIDKLECDIKELNRVAGARPFIYLPQGVLMHNGERVLNISTVKTLDPAPAGEVFTFEDLKTKAPFFYTFISTLFDDPTDSEISQMTYFLGWLKHFYENAFLQRPQVGQALVIVGGEAVGKSFLCDVILEILMGGTFDARRYLVQGESWTDFVSYPVLKVDDATALADYKALTRYSTLLKSLVANTLQTTNTKYAKVGSVLWHGRVIVNMNDDPQSMQLLPSLEVSSTSKISFLKVKRSDVTFGRREDNVKLMKKELPYVARFLIEWKIPLLLRNLEDTRYFLKPYHHPALLAESMQSGSSQSLLELMHGWVKVWMLSYPDATEWVGKSSELLTLMGLTDGLAPLMRHYDTRKLGRELSVLASRKAGIEKLAPLNGFVRYKIPFNIFGYSSDKVEAIGE